MDSPWLYYKALPLPLKVTPSQIPRTTTKERQTPHSQDMFVCVFRFLSPSHPFLSGVHCAPGLGIGAGQKGKSSLCFALTFVPGEVRRG